MGIARIKQEEEANKNARIVRNLEERTWALRGKVPNKA